MSEFAPGNAPTLAVEGGIPTPILAHTNGGDAMPVSAPDTAQTVDSDHALRRPSAANDDAEHVDDTGWVRIVVALRAGGRPTRAGRMVGKEYVVNGDLAGYHIATHADIPQIEIEFLEEHDPWFGAIGAKGIGEMAMVGGPAAIGSAIFNATGRRLRTLPFTLDKVLTV